MKLGFSSAFLDNLFSAIIFVNIMNIVNIDVCLPRVPLLAIYEMLFKSLADFILNHQPAGGGNCFLAFYNQAEVSPEILQAGMR